MEKNIQNNKEVEEKLVIACEKRMQCCYEVSDCGATLHIFPSGKDVFQRCGCSGNI
ncbi:hypothetical protein [Bacillus wiedmannii]|uniref:hypothetical protein n=1 Tax=Bacillus wiedmannii TaxID=1890302 RepID=UPI0021CF42B5|nr:hypothetical protein [Bacillus wiedmannii]MCU5096112.1 hypothetical protein [Bacillus wiedmannii]